MREILFRGKRKESGRWIYGYLVPKETNSYADGILIIDEALNYDELDNYYPSLSTYSVVPETIGQYTGLNDKNGKKIFEGDIVKYKNNSPCKVGYIDGQFVMKWKNSYRNLEQVYDEKIEIIGNTHDNPELLGGIGMKEDEKLFFVLCFYLRMKCEIDVRNIINMLQPFIHKKRLWYLLEKWFRKGFYDYRVRLDLGWFEIEKMPNRYRDLLFKVE